MKILLLLGILSSAFAVVPWNIEECKVPNKRLAFNSATLAIAPAKGTENEISLYGTALDHVELDLVLCKTYLSGVLVSTIEIRNIDVYDQGDPVTFVYQNFFPTYTPSGKYLVNFEFYDIVNVAVGCAGIRFSL